VLKIAARIFDIYDDEQGEIARLLPEGLHSVKVAERAEIDALADHQFALVMKTADGTLRRRLPVHTADAVKLSRAYFDTIKGTLPVEMCKVAERKLENPQDTKVAYVDVTKLQPAREKVAFKEQHFGLTIEGRDCFPLHDETLVKTAVARFPFTINDLNPEERFLYARNISKRAAALNVEIPTESPINLYTSDEVNRIALKSAIEQRKMAVASTKLGTEVLDQLMQAAGCHLEKGSIETDDSFALRQGKQAALLRRGALSADNIVAVLQHFDKLAGFNSQHYLRGLLDPFAACFKKADFDTSNMFVDGVDLSAIDPNALQQMFDEDLAHSFAENPVQVYRSLPDPIKSVIRQMAEQAMTGGTSADNPSSDNCQKNQPSTVASGGGEPSDRLNPSFVNGNY
jgi:hypothetical protein